MRALWTAASGMIAQQKSVDTISNNISNLNTTGYKKESAQFKTLLYQTVQEQSTDANGREKPVGIQTGLGVRHSAVVSQYKQGSMQETGGDFDYAIQGDGFFMVALDDSTVGYTRNGSFGVSVGPNGLTLATSEGRPVLDTTGAPIVFNQDISSALIESDDYGNLFYPDEQDNMVPMNIQIGLVQFNNPAGLQKSGNSMLLETAASGTPRLEDTDVNLKKSTLKNGYLEGSNVAAATEMVDLIVTQRAYEMSSKAITAADEMMQQANNLRR